MPALRDKHVTALPRSRCFQLYLLCYVLLAGVLRSTFLSLQRESPKQLLARQLLSAAATPGAWWSSQQCFAASAAVGSILGWLLGLGDRHLDNLLLDTESGELLHIDFSVCFDKGAGLGVPELVPFRMTQMMQVSLEY
jgi:phosphatidylinositol kinase/protein kinase (PI-3  family)